MKLVKTLLGVLFASALFTVTAIGATNSPVTTSSGNSDLWTATVGGAGSVQTSGGNEAVAGLNFSIARQTTLFFKSETGVRQSIGWGSLDNKNVGSWELNTKVFNDWNVFRVGNFQVLAGGNGGLSYGNRTPAWTVAPEVEARLWLKKDVYFGTRVDYNFDVTNTSIKSQDNVGITAFLGFSF
jgi:hypothetical protein